MFFLGGIGSNVDFSFIFSNSLCGIFEKIDKYLANQVRVGARGLSECFLPAKGVLSDRTALVKVSEAQKISGNCLQRK